MKRRIPVWLHVPWFLLALAGVIAWYSRDAGWGTWIWADGTHLPFRLSVLALSAWGICSRWMADVSPATLRRVARWLLNRPTRAVSRR